MKLTIVVQGIKGSGAAPAAEAQLFLVKGVLIDGTEVAAKECTLICTPNELLTFNLRGTAIKDGFSAEQLDQLWKSDDDALRFGPLEVEFREAT